MKKQLKSFSVLPNRALKDFWADKALIWDWGVFWN
jgi:hypothetical protein